jgi:hypothetical protein
VFPALTTHDAAAVVFAHLRDGVLVSRDGVVGW